MNAPAEETVAYVMLGNSPLQHHVASMEVLLEPIGQRETAPVVNALAASQNGRFLAAAGDDHAIRIVDAGSGRTIRTLTGHIDWIQSLTFSRDAQQLYSAGNDGQVLCWQHGYPIRATKVVQLPYAVRSLSLATEKQLLAIGGFSREILVWDLAAGQIKHRFQSACGDQRCVRFSPDGKQLLCGGRDGSVHVWDLTTGQPMAAFNAHQGRVYTAAFSADGTQITSVGEDRKLIQYDLVRRQIRLQREMAPAKLMSMCMINDDLVAVAGADNSIHLYDALADEVIAHLKGHFGTVASMTPCGNFLASGSFDTTIRIWDLESIQRDDIHYGKPVYAPLKMDTNLRIR